MTIRNLTIACALLLSLFAQSAFALIGENEKQIEARYGKPKKVIYEGSESRFVSYVARGFAIDVRFIAGISKAEFFQPLDKSTFTEEEVKHALALSADKGQSWQSAPLPQPNAPLNWVRSDGKVMATSTDKSVDVGGITVISPELSQTNENVGPERDKSAPNVTNALSGRYRIIQNRTDPRGLRDE